MSAPRSAVFAALTAAVACSSPTAPGDGAGGRFEPTVLAVSCFGNGSVELACTARIDCAGLACSQSVYRDVSAEVAWTAVGTSVRHTGGGRFAAAGTGAAAVVASLPAQRLESSPLAVEVFPGGQPQQVYRMFGRIGHGQMSGGPFPMPTIEQPINGVAVEIVAGLAVGRQGASGRPGDSRPGLPSYSPAPGEFEIIGVPTAPLTIEVRPPGQAPIRIDLTGPHFLPPILIPR